jgi:hypothetical protein
MDLADTLPKASVDKHPGLSGSLSDSHPRCKPKQIQRRFQTVQPSRIAVPSIEQSIEHSPTDLVGSLGRAYPENFEGDLSRFGPHCRWILTFKKCVEQLMHGS